MAEKSKSLWKAYVLWLFGGIFGLHHFYLRRDRQAFICWSTFGGYVVGWLGDVFTLPGMVREANEEPTFIDGFKEQVKKSRKPPFNIGKFCSAVMVAYLWAQVFMIAVPDFEYLDINWKFLHWVVPFVVSLGVWTVGNCGREKGDIWKCMAAAYLTYPIRYFVYDETYWLLSVVVVSTLVFDQFSKEWLLTPPKKRSLKRRVATLYVCGCIYLALFASYFYFNGKVTNSEGDEVPVYELLTEIFSTPWWPELKKSLLDTYDYAQHNGWYDTIRQVIESLDVDKEANAFKVLGLLPTASQSEITTVFRKLSRENHPDKVKGSPKEKRAAEERFMEISQAYEVLSKLKSKRRRNNRKSTKDEPSGSDTITL